MVVGETEKRTPVVIRSLFLPNSLEKQKAASRIVRGPWDPICCITVPSRANFQELLMKRIIVALVLALSVVSVVGCGGGSATTGGTKAK
ncbi:hypothetical protein FTUN_0333 [Frigoriglobus tundricola]|uniref:Uncharacterized protein n=1 Tax=Frigoriglobus tundricola TaxID=2774151 RepID=A0A6M5YHU2_9BACT|nr:hypothetical protein FTUN_0333 [Frigoriglobus tundricola]